MLYRLKRVIKEVLGKNQYPRKVTLSPSNHDEIYLSAIIRPGAVIFDVGANQGALCEYMACLAGVGGKVVAFEPVWKTYERLCERLHTSFVERANIVTIPLGLSNECKIVEIHMPAGADALASLASLDKSDPNGVIDKCSRAGVSTLDMFMYASQIQVPDLIKIDVEGAEFNVLMGGRSFFKEENRPVLFIEVYAPWLRKFGNTPWDVLGYLQSIGYRHYFMCPGGLVEHLSTLQKPFPDEFRMGYNVISYIPERHDWVRLRLDPYLASRSPSLPPMDPPTLPNVE